MVKTSNKNSFVLKKKFHLSIQHNMHGKIFETFLIRSNLKSRILHRSKENTKSLEEKGKARQRNNITI